MPNVVVYNNVDWQEGSPVAGERMATNGHYTGEHLGSVMQDEAVDGTEVAHAVEAGIVRYGTMMQDAKDENFPTVVTGD